MLNCAKYLLEGLGISPLRSEFSSVKLVNWGPCWGPDEFFPSQHDSRHIECCYFSNLNLIPELRKKNHPGYVWNPLEIVKRTSFRAVRERLFCCCFTSATRKKPCHVNHVSIDGQGLHFQLENVWVYILVVIFLVSISLDLNPFCQPLSKDLPLHLLGLCCLLLLAATLRKGQGTRGEKPPKPT